ncbi:MAG: hypothetical protein HY584_04820 [Candidatus Omnitrophica bacterium]|nr:hypothetical protein [Candidatus Omnitrophota bacterium]
MKAFFVGLLFLAAVLVMTGLGILLFPLLLILTLALRIAVGFLLIILAIWLLGKFIIFVWDALSKRTPTI